MARCRCQGDGPCTCHLVAGANVLIVGDGTEAAPWVISSETSVVVPPATIMTGAGIVGDGTPGNPLRVCFATYQELTDAGLC